MNLDSENFNVFLTYYSPLERNYIKFPTFVTDPTPEEEVLALQNLSFLRETPRRLEQPALPLTAPHQKMHASIPLSPVDIIMTVNYEGRVQQFARHFAATTALRRCDPARILLEELRKEFDKRCSK